MIHTTYYLLPTDLLPTSSHQCAALFPPRRRRSANRHAGYGMRTRRSASSASRPQAAPFAADSRIIRPGRPPRSSRGCGRRRREGEDESRRRAVSCLRRPASHARDGTRSTAPSSPDRLPVERIGRAGSRMTPSAPNASAFLRCRRRCPIGDASIATSRLPARTT